MLKEVVFQTLIGTVKGAGVRGNGGWQPEFQTLIGTVKGRRRGVLHPGREGHV